MMINNTISLTDNVEMDEWIGCYRVRTFRWIDNEYIYVNVQYFLPGSSICSEPAWDRTVYVTLNEKGIYIVKNMISSLVNKISQLQYEKGQKVVFSF